MQNHVPRADDDGRKARARAAVRRALASGQLVKPNRCRRCGEAEKFGADGRSLIHAHHGHGYDRHLEVEWLCVKCHFQDDERPKGETNGRAKINMDVAREIRRRYSPGVNRHFQTNSARALAREFGLSNRTIGRIIQNEIWIDAALAEGEG